MSPPDAHRRTPAGRLRARGLGVRLRGEPGRANAITDVGGVEVGHATLVRGDDVRTGATAIHPRGRARPDADVVAGWFSLHGNGELTGSHWIGEAGWFRLPAVLTTTTAVGVAHAAVLSWTVRHKPEAVHDFGMPVVGETWDGWLNDVDGGHVDEALVHAALDAARPGPVEEGSVGGGTGMICYAFKGGIGTASRRVTAAGGDWTVGALVQANFGRREDLVVAGVPVGAALADLPNPWAPLHEPQGPSSICGVVATDAPLLSWQCTALAKRAALGMARTGGWGAHTSGDLFLAFSTGNPGREPGPERLAELRYVPHRAVDPLYLAAVEATEEAILDALVANAPMTGRLGHHAPALPHDEVRRLLGLTPP